MRSGHLAGLALVLGLLIGPLPAIAQPNRDAVAGTAAALQARAAELQAQARALLEGVQPAESLAGLVGRLAPGPPALPEGVPFQARFVGELPGLEPGAPVLASGVRIGTVRAVTVDFTPAPALPAVTVRLDVLAERITVDGQAPGSAEAVYAMAEALVGRGLRARLRPPLPVLGGAGIELVMAGEPGAAGLDRRLAVPVLPTLPAAQDGLAGALDQLLARLEALPIETIGAEAVASFTALHQLAAGPELQAAVTNLVAATAAVGQMLPRLEARAGPAFAALDGAAEAARGTALQAQRAVSDFDRTLGGKAPIWTDLQRLVRELDATLRAARSLVELLERHPDALLRGRGGTAL